MKELREIRYTVRLTKSEIQALKQSYSERKKAISEHCPSVDPDRYKLSDHIRETLLSKEGGNL